MVRAIAAYQCCQGSISRLVVIIMWVEFESLIPGDTDEKLASGIRV